MYSTTTPVIIFIISNLTFSMQCSLLLGWKKLSIPSASRTPTARREPSSINVLARPDTPPVCGTFQQIPLLHNSWRTGNTRKGTTSLVNKEVSDLRRVSTQRVIVSLALSCEMRASKISGIRSCFPRVNTPRRISSIILVLRFLHFLHTHFKISGEEH